MTYFIPQTKKTFSPTSRDILAFPFGEFYEAETTEDLTELANKYGLGSHSSWLIPQMLAKIAEMTLVKDDNDMILPLGFLEANFTTAYLKGIWKVCARLPRSALVKGQNKDATYSALVPLILCAFKKFHNVEYKSWSQVNIDLLVERNLAEAMCVPPNDIPDLSTKEILDIRQQGLTVATGARAGTVEAPTAKWALTGIKDTELGHLPKLAVTMITQIWVAHPTLRNKYMVLDPNDWDNMPEPLITAEVQPAKMFSTTNLASKWK